MAATDQQRLDALRDSYLRIAEGDVKSAAEQARSMGFHSLKELGDEIERLETKVAAQAGRTFLHPVKRVPQ